MKSNAYLLSVLCLVFLGVSSFANVIHAQGARTREERISILRRDIRDLELLRDELREDIRKVESRDESNRSRYVVVSRTGSIGYSAAVGYVVIPREVWERQMGLGVLLGNVTMERAIELDRGIKGITTAFPQVARETLSKLDPELSKKKRELEALEASELLAALEPTRSSSVSGTWEFVCCGGKYKWTVTLNQNGNTITGSDFQGQIEGKISGSSVKFERRIAAGVQEFSLTLSSDGKTLSGNFSGPRDLSAGTDVTARWVGNRTKTD